MSQTTNPDHQATAVPSIQQSSGRIAEVARVASERRDETESPAETCIEARDFSCWYGDFQALHNVHLVMLRNRVTALIGPSGCGKSTFLRWINRMNDLIPGAYCTGHLELDGQSVVGADVDAVDLRKRVGMVFQKPNPFPKSIQDNILFGPRLHRKLKRSHCEEIVERALRGAALWDEVKDRLARSALGLSGGQQQRLCIARAIALAPEVLLMDEPCSALDPKSTARIEDLIGELRSKYTIIIVTHNMQQAARVSDVTAFFNVGKIVESGRTIDIFTRPSRPETEDYITGRFG